MSKTVPLRGIESLPVEIMDQILLYHASSRAFLKNLRLVRPFHKSASSLVCHSFCFTLTPDDPDKLQKICQTTFSDYIETLSLELDYAVYAFNKTQWDEETVQAARASIEASLKFFPRLKHLVVRCLPRLSWSWCGVHPTTRPDVLNSAITALTLSPPQSLTTLEVKFPERLVFNQLPGDAGLGTAAWLENLREISFTFDQAYQHEDDAVCELLQHGRNLRSVKLTRYTRVSSTPSVLVHPDAPLECLELRDVQISSESLTSTIANFKGTLKCIVLADLR